MSTTLINPAVISRIAAELKPSARTPLDMVSARELDARTAYKASGLTAVRVRDLIYEEWNRQTVIQRERSARRPAPSPQPGRVLRLVSEKAENLKRTARQFAECQRLLEAQRRKGQARIGSLIFRGVEEGEWVNDRYSRSWHRQHGGVWEVSERRVDMLAVNRCGELEVIRSVQLQSFRGHWLVRSIVELLDLEKVSVPTPLKPVQMGDYYSIRQLRSIAGVDLYVRMLAGEIVDYAVAVGGETYHAESPREAIRGLRRKISERERAEAARVARDREMITAEYGSDLGFCAAGMEEFCDFNGLDIDGRYSRGELRRVVGARKAENRDRWGTELLRAGLL